MLLTFNVGKRILVNENGNIVEYDGVRGDMIETDHNIEYLLSLKDFGRPVFITDNKVQVKKTIQEEYFEKYNKEVPRNKKNDLEWIRKEVAKDADDADIVSLSGSDTMES